VRPDVHRTPPTRAADVFVWLGGGSRHDIDEHAERSTYQTAGLVVAVNVVVAAAVVYLAASRLGASVPVRAVLALAAAALVGALGRALATAPVRPDASRPRRVGGEAARLLVAVLLGLALGEVTGLVSFAGGADAEMLAQGNAAASAATEGPPDADLAQLRADRGALDAQLAAATARRDQALVVARCEYRPSAGCPATRITGDPGRGPETTQAQTDLAAAERDLNAVTARRDQLDRSIADTRAAQAEDRSVARALAGTDTGLDARWSALNAYTLRNGGAMLLRSGVDALLVLLMALPLLLRWWRGQTEQDHELLSRSLRRRAERDAETAVVINRARQRVAIELRTSPEVQAHLADPVTAQLMAGGSPGHPPAGFPAGTGAPAGIEGLDDAPAERPGSGAARIPATAPAELEPVARPGRAEIEARPRAPMTPPGPATPPPERTPLDLLPQPLSSTVRVVGALVRPFVPGPVARIAAVGPRSLRVARGLWEEVEEVQVTVRQHRTVRSATDEWSAVPPETAQPAETAEPDPRPRRSRSRPSTRPGAEMAVADPEDPSRTWADAEVMTEQARRRRGRPVEAPVADAELADPDPAPAIRGRSRRALPPSDPSDQDPRTD
jgi:hypothetical protein